MALEHKQPPTEAATDSEPTALAEGEGATGQGAEQYAGQGAEQSEAEAALARLEDRIGAYNSYTLAADYLELRQIFAGSLERMKEEDWGKRTEKRAHAWTRRQTLAHLIVATRLFHDAAEAGLGGRPVAIPGLEVRTDLKAANKVAMDAFAEQSPAELTELFLGELERGARLAAPLGAEGLGQMVPVPFYGTPPTVAELFGCALAHAGVVHGAQIASARSRPIWIFFQPGLMRRQLTRFMHMLGLAYWPEKGGDLHATINFEIAGQGGGSWIIRVSPEGGHGKIGLARTSDLRFTVASADRFCKLMTFQSPFWRALLTRQLKLKGNVRLAQRLPELFLPM